MVGDDPYPALAPAPSNHLYFPLPPTTPSHVNTYVQYIHDTMWKYVPMFSGMLTCFGIIAHMNEFVPC